MLLFSACCTLWQSLHLASAATIAAEAVACKTDRSCNRGNSLLQMKTKPSRTTIASIQDLGSELDKKRSSKKDEASVDKELNKSALSGASIQNLGPQTSRTSAADNASVGKQVIPPVAVANVESGSPGTSATLMQDTQAMWRSLAMVYQTRTGLGIGLVVLLCGLCLCMVCIIVSLINLRHNLSHRRDLVGPGRGHLSAIFGEMSAQPAGRLLRRQTQESAPSSRPATRPTVGYRGGQSQPQLAIGASSSKTLCPGLVVPERSDCVLVLRVLPRLHSAEADFGDAAAGKGAVEHQIFDLPGRPVLSTSVVQPWPKQGMAVVTLRPLNSLRTADSMWLSQCRAGQDSKSINIYGKDDSLFGSLKRDGPRYVLGGVAGADCSLFFEGKFEEHQVQILDAQRNMIALAEPCRMEFDPDGSFYQARMAAGVDVAIVLSALLSIDAMEASHAELPS